MLVVNVWRAITWSTTLHLLICAITVKIFLILVHLLTTAHSFEFFDFLWKASHPFILMLLLLSLSTLIVLQLGFLFDLVPKFLTILILHGCHSSTSLNLLLLCLFLPLGKLHVNMRVNNTIALSKR